MKSCTYCTYLLKIYDTVKIMLRSINTYRSAHRRTGRCGVLAIGTWAAWFWAAQGRLLTKKKEERKGRKGKRKTERGGERKEKEKREEKKGKKT